MFPSFVVLFFSVVGQNQRFSCHRDFRLPFNKPYVLRWVLQLSRYVFQKRLLFLAWMCSLFFVFSALLFFVWLQTRNTKIKMKNDLLYAFRFVDFGFLISTLTAVPLWIYLLTLRSWFPVQQRALQRIHVVYRSCFFSLALRQLYLCRICFLVTCRPIVLSVSSPKQNPCRRHSLCSSCCFSGCRLVACSVPLPFFSLLLFFSFSFSAALLIFLVSAAFLVAAPFFFGRRFFDVSIRRCCYVNSRVHFLI